LARPASGADVTQLYQSALPNVSSKDFSVITVVYKPGERSRPHRHGQAFVFAYVLEGSVRSQVEGEPEHIYKQGESWSEAPGAHHVVSGNRERHPAGEVPRRVCGRPKERVCPLTILSALRGP
jgi:quercetin dioxygenase-like cupin family protein